MSTLIDIINSPEFIDSVVEATEFTVEHDKESAFAVYKNSDGLDFSRVIKGRNDSGDDLRDELSEEFARLEDDFMNSGVYTTINMSSLTQNVDKYDKITPRKDIFLQAHTHPILRASRNSMLTPSITDLETAEKLEINNPGVVSVIIVPEKELSIANLLLYRRNPSQTFIPRYHSMDYMPAYPAILKSLEDCGFLATVVELDEHRSFDSTIQNLENF